MQLPGLGHEDQVPGTACHRWRGSHPREETYYFCGMLAVKGQLLLGLVTLQNTASTRFCNMYCNHFHSSPQRDLVEQYDGDNEDDPLFTAL